MRYIKFSSVLLFLMLLTSCTASLTESDFRNTMNHWIDHYEWELIERVGPPTCRENDGKGGEILVYKYAANGVQIPGKISSSGNNIYYTYPTQLKTKLTMQFYVNPKGKIYHCRCESNIDEMNSVTNFYIILLIIYVGAGLILLNTI